MATIRITAGEVTAAADLNDSPTAHAIFQALPIDGVANRWGQEIYFDIPVTLEAEPEARADVEVGELGYWPMGAAFCIFFGPTPASRDEKPRAYSPVNVFGRITGDARLLKAVSNGDPVQIKLEEQA